MKNRMFNKVIISILCIFIILILLQILIPNFDRVAITEIMPDLKEGKIAFVVDGNISSNDLSPIVKDDNILLPTSLIKTYIDFDIFLNDPYVIIAKNDKYIKIKEDQKEYYENYGEKTFNTLPLLVDGDIYIPIEEFKNFYNIDLKFIEERNILIMNTTRTSRYVATVTKDAVLREGKSYKSRIVDDILEGEQIVIYNVGDKYSYAIKENGSIGYIKSDLYTITKEHNKVNESDDINVSTNDMYNNKVNLLWYQISSKERNPKVENLKHIDSLTVMSPTWFEMIRADGTIREKIDPSVVTWAHQNGYDVWALMTNPFGDKELSHQILSNVEAREKAIKELIRLSKENDIDGINIDIESISKETGIYYVQFIRELSVFTHLNDLILSVDMYMPTNYTEFYNRKEVGRLVDYYCLMAYDEHWRTSPESGSVASLPWVEEGVRKTLEVVPNHKVLLGIPSYTRRWGEKGGAIVQVDALGMETSRKDLEDNNARIVYLDDLGQNYGEYVKNGITYKIWLEDETSLRKRLDIAEKYSLGGVATWKQGFEKDEIWNIYAKYMEKEKK